MHRVKVACTCVVAHCAVPPQGMLSARGERLLMVDADGATLFKDIERLEKEMDRIAPESVGLVCALSVLLGEVRCEVCVLLVCLVR